MFIFRELLSSISTKSDTSPKTEIHLQDYNPSVLQLVTLPNLLLTWCTSLTQHCEENRTYMPLHPELQTAPAMLMHIDRAQTIPK